MGWRYFGSKLWDTSNSRRPLAPGCPGASPKRWPGQFPVPLVATLYPNVAINDTIVAKVPGPQSHHFLAREAGQHRGEDDGPVSTSGVGGWDRRQQPLASAALNS